MNAPFIVAEINIDPRAAFLGRAAARDALFRAGVIDLDEAFDELVEPFMAIVAPPVCGGQPCVNSSFCDSCRAADRQAPRHQPRPEQRTTPQATVDAILHSVRERGLQALKEPANVERLSRCDEAARAGINRRIEKLGASK